MEAGGIYALKTRSCVTEIRKKTFGIRKTARRFSACLAVCMAAAYFEKMKKIHFLETELPHTVSEQDLQPAEADRNHPRKARSCLSAKAGFSAAGGAGFDNELIPIIVSLVEQRALVLVEIPVLLIQP